ncbi:MAG: glycosyltransferase [Magnetococcales bacterium]|nr:glycosyltransferase [Magnetococcales bacterium]
MHVLLTVRTLNDRSGAITYTRDLALGLMRHGHHPVVYSPVHGTVAEELKQATIPCVTRLDQVARTPDIIHGQHHIETMVAALHFPTTPALFVCHDSVAWHDEPPLHPTIVHYVAVDETCRARLIQGSGIAPDKTSVIGNAVELSRFPRRSPLPERPKRALLFSNSRNVDQLAAIQQACAAMNLQLDRLGKAGSGQVSDPEHFLGNYDLVFAKGRAAMEAAAAGCAVILIDFAGLGEMVRMDRVEALRRANFGYRTLTRPHDANLLQEEISRYDARDAARVTDWVRRSLDSELLFAELMELYEQLIADYCNRPVDPVEIGRSASRYLSQWSYNRRFEWEQGVFRFRGGAEWIWRLQLIVIRCILRRRSLHD